MKIGVFDSGLGGLLLAQALRRELPEYDYLYLGDTKRVPYGNRTQETIYTFTEEAVRYLFTADCSLVIIACNTASSEALRRIQQEFLPQHFPDRAVLGLVIPAAEAVRSDRVGVLATTGTVNSGAFVREIQKIAPNTTITQVATPLLVPLIEQDGLKYLEPILNDYLQPIRDADCQELILGCTHYMAIKDQVRALLPNIAVISQDEVVPGKLRDYLVRHPEHNDRLSRNGTVEYQLTEQAPGYSAMVERLTGETIHFQTVTL